MKSVYSIGVVVIFILVSMVGGFIYNQAQAEQPCTYTVAQDGNGDFITIQAAADVAQPGETICVTSGHYDERITVTRSGASGSPIVFSARGTVINKGFSVRADYIHVVGFEITGTDYHYKDGAGVTVEGKYCEIRDNYIHHTPRRGILLYAEPNDSPSTSHCLVTGNRIEYVGLAGISIWGQNHIVEKNEISHTIQHPPNQPPVNGADADGMRFFGKGHIIRGNYIHDITFDDPENIDPHIDGFQTYGSIMVSDILIEGNYVDLPGPPAHTSCQYLTFSGAPVRNITIQNNIFITDAVQRCPINIRGVSGTIVQNIQVLNNTFVRTNQGHADVTAIYADGVVVKNNIFYHQSASTYPYYKSHEEVTNMDVGNNLMYTANGTPAGSPYPNDLWQINPEFVDYENHDYRLRPESPAIDAGISFPGVEVDFDGNVRPQGPAYDIGAFEYTGSGPLPIDGDLNLDGEVDILDVQLCVSVVMGTEDDPTILARADVNQDGTVDVLDVQEIVNISLGF
jgi:hypothetical protein